MNDMDTIENFNMKAGELQRLKLARRYRTAELLLEDFERKKAKAGPGRWWHVARHDIG